MKTCINLSTDYYDLVRYTDRADLKQFYQGKNIDGIELMLCGTKTIPDKIPTEDIIGIHLNSFPSWIDFWHQDEDALNLEYDNRETWVKLFGGENPKDLLRLWEQELDLAHKLNVKYVVFHASECTMEECVTYRQRHTDEEVCTALCEIINHLLKDKPYHFYFLVENLWWSGFTMTRPEITQQLMDNIHYEKKGIMLDTGHLLHTNNDLCTQDEGVCYIHSILEQNGDLCRFIKGVHLNQTMSGEYVKQMLQNPPKLGGTYQDRLSTVFSHIFKIDAHKPFVSRHVGELLERIKPQFLTYEFITCSREEHEQALLEQLSALKS